MQSKIIMILGAGMFQLPAIRKAVEIGYYTITVDYLPDNIGHRASNFYVNCSTVDREGVLQAARELQIEGICTFSSDVAIPTVGYVCDRLNLQGVSAEAADILATKHHFRAFQKERGFNCPRFFMARNFDGVWDGAIDLSFPVVVKPVDTSGSRGLSRIDRLDRSQLERAFNYALSFSRSGTICVEEFIEGVEVGGDGVLVDGRFAFIAITHKHLDGFVVRGHSFPTNIPERQQQQVIEELENCCRELGYSSGSLNFDVMVAPDKVTIIEMSPRNGGNGIASVINRSTGVDLEKGTLRLAMGESVSFPSQFRLLRGAGSLIFGSDREGILQHILDREQLLQKIPEVFDMQLIVNLGEKVLPLEHNGNAIGYVLFDCKDADEYDRLSERIIEALQIVVGRD